MEIKFKAKGMMCEGCANSVKKQLNKIKGITEINVNLDTKEVTVISDNEIEEKLLKKAVLKAGFQFEK